MNPQGSSTSWYFQYGPSASYGSKTSAKSAGSGTAATGVSAAITSLEAGTTYHYRLVGTSNAGTTVRQPTSRSRPSPRVTIASVDSSSSVYGHLVNAGGALVLEQPVGCQPVTILGEAFGTDLVLNTVGSASHRHRRVVDVFGREPVIQTT